MTSQFAPRRRLISWQLGNFPELQHNFKGTLHKAVMGEIKGCVTLICNVILYPLCFYFITRLPGTFRHAHNTSKHSLIVYPRYSEGKNFFWWITKSLVLEIYYLAAIWQESFRCISLKKTLSSTHASNWELFTGFCGNVVVRSKRTEKQQKLFRKIGKTQRVFLFSTNCIAGAKKKKCRDRLSALLRLSGCEQWQWPPQESTRPLSVERRHKWITFLSTTSCLRVYIKNSWVIQLTGGGLWTQTRKSLSSKRILVFRRKQVVFQLFRIFLPAPGSFVAISNVHALMRDFF